MIKYEVQAGDTLNEVAERFGINPDDVQVINRIANPDLIYVGQTLLIPQAIKDSSDINYHPSRIDFFAAAAVSGMMTSVDQQDGWDIHMLARDAVKQARCIIHEIDNPRTIS